MTQADLARRMKVSQPTIDGLERSELAGSVSLSSLRRAAEAMDCELVYALVPRRSIAVTIAARAKVVAARIMARTSRSMDLEDQSVRKAETESQLRDLARDLANRPPRGFWRDEYGETGGPALARWVTGPP